MPSVDWSYPQDELIAVRARIEAAGQIAAAQVRVGIDPAKLDFSYRLSGDGVAIGEPARPTERAVPIATRTPAPRPRQLSRRAITLFASSNAIGLAAALVFALSSGDRNAPPQETVSVDHRQSSDLLATAPKDYGAIASQKGGCSRPAIGIGAAGWPGSCCVRNPSDGTTADGASNNECAPSSMPRPAAPGSSRKARG